MLLVTNFTAPCLGPGTSPRQKERPNVRITLVEWKNLKFWAASLIFEQVTNEILYLLCWVFEYRNLLVVNLAVYDTKELWFNLRSEQSQLIEFTRNVFTEFSDKNISLYSKKAQTCHPANSCVRDKDATTVPARHMQGTGSLNWPWFMLHWFIGFPEFPEFLFHLGKTPLDDMATSCS